MNLSIRRLVVFVFAAWLVVGCGVPGPDGTSDSFGVDFTPPENFANFANFSKKDHARGAIVFVVDGVNAHVFRQLLEAGELPAVKKYFVDRGLYAPRAVANIPSVTLANITTLVTGRFPGHHGVTGVNWFDRRKRIWRNYNTIAQKNTLDSDYDSPNIYEQFSPADGEMTVSIFFQPHRGATKFFENRNSAGPAFFFGWWELVDRLTLFRFDEMMDLARARGTFPSLVFAYMLAADFQAYAHGVSSDQYRRALRHTDRQIGRLLGDLERVGMLEKIVIALVCDHGLGDVKRHFPIEKHLRDDLGLNVAPRRLWEQTPLEKRRDYYRRYSTVLYGSGDRYWAVCLRRPRWDKQSRPCGFEPWPQRPTAADLSSYPLGGAGAKSKRTSTMRADIPAWLVSRDAVDAVAWPVGDNRCCVRTKKGTVRFAQPAGPGGDITCTVIAGRNPLGWDGKVPELVLKGRAATPRQWLAATTATEYPDLPAQILAYFRAPRAGDLAVFAATGWDFNTSNRAGHGGLAPAEMHTPLLLAGPGVPKGQIIKTARTADLPVTLLKLLGKKPPPNLDGKNLLP